VTSDLNNHATLRKSATLTMSNPSRERANSLSVQTAQTNTTITGQEQVASPTRLDFHSTASLSPRDPNPNQANAMFGLPIGSQSSMGSMPSGCGCTMFSTVSGDEMSLCALHSQSGSAVPMTTSSLLACGDEMDPCATDSQLRAIPVRTSSLLVGNTARVLNETETSKPIIDR
jgi:hypothetical protein